MRKKRYHIGIIWANPYSKNFGVSALAYSLLFVLESVSQNLGIAFKYHLINNEGEKTDILNVGDKQITIYNIPLFSIDSLKIRSWIKTILKNPKGLFTILGLDVILDIGEGDSFSDIYGIERFGKINSSKQNLFLLGKKMIMLPQTIGPFNSSEAKKKAIVSLNKTHLVTTRDKQSYDYVKQLLPDKQIFELIDLGFFLPFMISPRLSSKIKVGINVSGLLWHGGYTKDNQFHLKANYRYLIDEIINLFLDDAEVEIELIAHVITKRLEENYNNVENDLKICDDLHIKYPKIKVGPEFSTPVEAKSYISNFDFFIGSRMHACIAAFSSGVPVFPLAYSRKFNGLFGDTLNYKFYGDLVNSNNDSILRDLKLAFNSKNDIKETIRIANDNIVKPRESKLITLIQEILPNFRQHSFRFKFDSCRSCI